MDDPTLASASALAMALAEVHFALANGSGGGPGVTEGARKSAEGLAGNGGFQQGEEGEHCSWGGSQGVSTDLGDDWASDVSFPSEPGVAIDEVVEDFFDGRKERLIRMIAGFSGSDCVDDVGAICLGGNEVAIFVRRKFGVPENWAPLSRAVEAFQKDQWFSKVQEDCRQHGVDVVVKVA